MPTLDDLVRSRTALGEPERLRLHELTRDWQLLADLSFADLVLWVPTSPTPGFVAVAQMRPTTGPTAFYDDLVGTVLPVGRRPQIDRALAEARICRERDPEWRDDVPVREETIPIGFDGRVIAVVARHTNLAAVRTPSRLELTYLQCADDLARMMTEGRFPFPGTTMGRRGAPRVGDGLIRLGRDGAVGYASPNAVSAYRRMGLATDLVGAHLGRTTRELAATRAPLDEALTVVLSGRSARRTEVEGDDAVLSLRVIPLERDGERVGALVLVRDVTEIRRSEHELLTKDATIREIHHRVKNNLQTVAALLRLQARRLTEPAAREALAEAVRRVASIALVHETLSRTLEEAADFDEIIDRLLAMAAETPGAAAVVGTRETSVGLVPGEAATPLALALSELLQNAVEHGLAGRGGRVSVRASRDGEQLTVEVCDDGRGLPEGLDETAGPSLGLQIVRTLIEHELRGTLELLGAPGGGTIARVCVPVPAVPAG